MRCNYSGVPGGRVRAVDMDYGVWTWCTESKFERYVLIPQGGSFPFRRFLIFSPVFFFFRGGGGGGFGEVGYPYAPEGVPFPFFPIRRFLIRFEEAGTGAGSSSLPFYPRAPIYPTNPPPSLLPHPPPHPATPHPAVFGGGSERGWGAGDGYAG